MSQIALPFDPATLAAAAAEPAGFDATGFEIGWDHAHHRLTPPADHLHGTHPVRQGWEAGRAAFGARTLQPTRSVRQWLGLRLQAWLRGQAFEDVMVTPRFLAQIDVATCPVTRVALTHGTHGNGSVGTESPSDAVIVRANVGAGCAAGNLLVMSRHAASARGLCSAAEAEDMARRLAAGDVAAGAGLTAAQWLRLAALLRMATPLAHAQVACLPLRVLPPNRLRVLNPVQALQALLTLLFTGSAYARRMMELGALMPNTDARRSYVHFMNTLLARRLAVGWAAERAQVRSTLEDAWGHPVVMRRWEQLALRLGRADCERIVRLAAQRGLGGAGWRWVDDDAATEGWALESQGRAAVPGERANPVPNLVLNPASTSAQSLATAAAPSTTWRRARSVLPPPLPAASEAAAVRG